MSCHEFQTGLHDLFVGKISEEEFEPLKGHIDACEACAELHRLAFELSCREFVEFLDDYVEGTLDPERRAVFDRHLTICPDCTNYLDSYRKTIELGRMALRGEGATPPGPVPESLLQAILDALDD